jgi:N4-gp56 family major capsid protein
MALTNFSALLDNEKTVWSRDVWKVARNNSFVMKFAGSSINSPVHRITELTKTERGERAIIPLVTDLTGDGVVGDNVLWDNEEELKAYDEDIYIDQLRNANRHKGRMEHQKTVINFREQSRDKLGYWLGDRIDQLGFLTLSGIDYRLRPNGSLRPGFTHNGSVWARNTTTAPVGQALIDLAFASDQALGDRLTAPTANRHRRWNGTAKALEAGNTANIAVADRPSYAMLVETKAFMKDQYIRGVRAGGGDEVYHVFMSPQGLAKLKLDPDFLANVRHAGARGGSNPVFSGAIVTVDGLVIHEYRHVFNTAGAILGTSVNGDDTGKVGFKWGADAKVNGQRTLFLGAQALGIADLGTPYWNEEQWDYDNQNGISIGKIFGVKKPQFHSIYTGAKEDFGVVCVDCAI